MTGTDTAPAERRPHLSTPVLELVLEFVLEAERFLAEHPEADPAGEVRRSVDALVARAQVRVVAALA